MAQHSREMLEQMLPEAETLVDRGAKLIQAQEARVTALEGKGATAHQSRKLLNTMKQTQELQIAHVMLLRRELAGCD